MTSRALRLEVEGQAVHGVLEGVDDPCLPVVVYVHGFGSSGFGTKGDYFSACFIDLGLPFCRFDLRGHGRSAGSLGEISVGRNLLDLEAVIADLRRRGFTRFVLAGSSYGALTSLVYCSRDSHGIVGGVFIAAAIDIADCIRRREGDEAIAAWRSAGQAPLEDGDRLAWGFYEDAERWSGKRIATNLEMPCLLFHGLRDEEVDWCGVLDFAMRAASVEVHGFIDGDHRLIEHLPRIWEETERFVGRLELGE